MGRDDEDKEDSGPVYKTKVVQFFNRSVPIILQNDNGPCPLLAICKTAFDLHSSICTLILYMRTKVFMADINNMCVFFR